MLEIEALKIRYGDLEAVRDFSLRMDADEIVTLVGPTGCGKTSVLRTVAGLETPSSGVVKIGGMHISHEHWVPPEKRQTGLVFQDFALFPHLNVAQNVGFRVKEPMEVDRWLKLLGLESHRKAMPDTLSGGQKQRVALARALAHKPNIVLLDEPLSNLDLSLKLELRRQIRDTLKTVGVAAVWVTHDQEEALSVGDRVGIMNAGRLEQIGPPEECYSTPATHFVASFLGDGIFLRGEMENDCVHTVLGCTGACPSWAPFESVAGADAVDVLVRPHDLSLEAAQPGNGQIQWCRFEGETRLYGVYLDDGPLLKVRVNHEQYMVEGQRVQIRVAAQHPLAVLPQRNVSFSPPGSGNHSEA